MNRRGFLRGLVGGVAVAAAAPTFPFRVFSFPTEIVVPQFHPNLSLYGKVLRDVYQDAIREQVNQLSVARLFRKVEFEPIRPGMTVTLHSHVSNLTT